jgi:hypothetical protein
MKGLTDGKMLAIIDKAWEGYHGDVTVLNSAIGALVMGRRVGWHGIRVMYSRVTYNRYERLLGIKFRDVLPERGPDAERLRGIRIIDSIGKFWQAISSGLVSAKEAAQTA